MDTQLVTYHQYAHTKREYSFWTAMHREGVRTHDIPARVVGAGRTDMDPAETFNVDLNYNGNRARFCLSKHLISTFNTVRNTRCIVPMDAYVMVNNQTNAAEGFKFSPHRSDIRRD